MDYQERSLLVVMTVLGGMMPVCAASEFSAAGIVCAIPVGLLCGYCFGWYGVLRGRAIMKEFSHIAGRDTLG